MSDGLATALGVIGVLLLLEVLDITGLLRRKISGVPSAREQETRLEELEARVEKLERERSP